MHVKKLIVNGCCFIGMVIFFLQHAEANAQKQTLSDSLESVINSTSHDTLKIKAYIDLSRAIRTSNADKALAALTKADSLANIHNRLLDRMRISTSIGILNAMQGNYPEALSWMENALGKARNQKFPKGIAENLENIGILNRHIGNYSASQKYYLQALTIYDSIGDLTGISSTYQNLGVVTDLLSEQERAMEYYQKALVIEQSLENSRSIANIKNNMAIIEHKRQNNPLAIQLLREALVINKERNDMVGVTSNYLNLGNFLNKDAQHRMAMLYLDSAYSFLANSNNRFSQASLAYNYAESHLALNNKPKALEYAQENLRLAEEIKGFKVLADAHLILSRIYEESQDHINALDHHKAFTSFQDSLFNETKNREIANYQVQLDVFFKNKQIADQEFEMLKMNQTMLKERRLLVLFIIITFLSILVVYLLVQKFLQTRRTSLKLKKQNLLIVQQKEEIESVNRQLEMRLLRAQLNPHFIFNALSSIQHLIFGNEKSSALNYMGKFSRLLRQVLDNAAETTVTLVEEVKLLKAYIELESLRFNHDFRYEISTSDDIDAESVELPALLVQPLIENAIIHGLLPSKKEKLLLVFFKLENENLICEIQDNGVGRHLADKNKSQTQQLQKSHGLNITRQRIANRLSGMENEQTITYVDLKNDKGEITGTRAIIQIPSTF